MQSPRPRWPVSLRGIPDQLTQWRRVGWIYWLYLARSISLWGAFIKSCLPVNLVINQPSGHFSLSLWLTYWFIDPPSDQTSLLLPIFIGLIPPPILSMEAKLAAEEMVSPVATWLDFVQVKLIPSMRSRPFSLVSTTYTVSIIIASFHETASDILPTTPALNLV